MKIMILPAFALSVLLFSCKNNRTDNNNQQETPKALEDKSSSYELVSKRGYDDLIESLYDELVSKDIELKRFEEMISDLDKSKSDSTEAFDKFNTKNLSYYTSAKSHLSTIKDSLVREKIQALVIASLNKYTSSIAKHSQLLNLIEEKELTISDLRSVLKIVKTLPLIEKYQNDNLPAERPIENYILQQNKAIQLGDSLSNNFTK